MKPFGSAILLVRPARIRVHREEPPRPAETDYRTPPAATPQGILTLSWASFIRFDVFWLLFVGVPLAGLMGLVVAMVVGSSWVLLLPTAWLLAAAFFNRVVVRVDGEWITSRLVPVPIWPSKSLLVESIEHVIASQRGRFGGTNVQWYVVAITRSRSFPLITRRLRRRHEAVFVARTIEQHLGLPSSAQWDGQEGETDLDD